jgi:hypothetical protein
VHIDDLTSADIRVTVLDGAMTLHLPPEGPYAIDAKSDFGGVQSDFPGHEKRKFWLVGHRFVEAGSAPHKLYLRIGFGDITLLKIDTPVTPAPLTH